MTDELNYAALEEIRIDPLGPALLFRYAIPDQGGARLFYEYRISTASTQPLQLRTGYVGDKTKDAHHDAEFDLRLVRDAVAWIDEQLATPGGSSRGSLRYSLERLREVVVAAE